MNHWLNFFSGVFWTTHFFYSSFFYIYQELADMKKIWNYQGETSEIWENQSDKGLDRDV